MGKKEYRKLLEMASEQVECGIYAIEKDGSAELRCDRGSVTRTKRLRRAFKQQGYRVYANGI